MIDVEEVGKIVESLLDSLAGDVSSLDLRVHNELEALAGYIRRAKDEVAAIRPEDIANEHIPLASVELGAIGTHLEEATDVILDACEMVEEVGKDIDGEAGARLDEAVNRIYEACNFQDMSGQRITKIVGTLQEIERRVDRLLMAFGHPDGKAAAAPAVAPEPKGDADLLNGPQLPNKAVSQDDIDKLLASFD